MNPTWIPWSQGLPIRQGVVAPQGLNGSRDSSCLLAQGPPPSPMLPIICGWEHPECRAKGAWRKSQLKR